MKGDPLLRWSARWFTLLLRLYPADFRDEMGRSWVEAYEDRAREARKRAGFLGLAALWLRALADALRSGPGERAHPPVRGAAAAGAATRNWRLGASCARRRLSEPCLER